MLEAVQRIVREDRPHAGIELVITCQEEVSLRGAEAFDRTRLHARIGYVYDQAAPIGEIVQQNMIGKIRFSLEAGGHTYGSINAENWRAWNFSIQDHAGEEVARITKTWEGLATTLFTTADNFVVQIHRQLDEPLRRLGARIDQRKLGHVHQRQLGRVVGDRRRRQVDRAGQLAVRVQQVVGAPGRRALGGEHAGGAADQRPELAALPPRLHAEITPCARWSYWLTSTYAVIRPSPLTSSSSRTSNSSPARSRNIAVAAT